MSQLNNKIEVFNFDGKEVLSDNNFFSIIKKLHNFLNKRQNRNLIYLICIFILSTFFELSFITLFAILKNKVLMNIDNSYIVQLGYEYTYYIYLLLIILFLKSYFQYIKVKYNARFSYNIMGNNMHNLISKYTKISYMDFLLKKQSDMTKNITQEVL